MAARVVLTKIGLDGHERGVMGIGRNLMNQGMEVVYLGMFQTPGSIVKTVLEEDADVLGLSYHSGLHIYFTKKIISLLKKQDLKNDVLLIVGGVIPPEDIGTLKKMGVDEVFPSGSLINSISNYIVAKTSQARGRS